MSKISRYPGAGKPSNVYCLRPHTYASQRPLFREYFVAEVLGLESLRPHPKYMPPSVMVYDDHGGRVVAWELQSIVHFVATERPERLPHLAEALRRHIHRIGMGLKDVEAEMAAVASECG